MMGGWGIEAEKVSAVKKKNVRIGNLLFLRIFV